ncbi:hypothetical protein NS201_05230 [Pseudomonas oryzihabitans]|nr:hypothetical protein NS201_05230 [Pseudomonas psychrotolerans]
MQMIQSSSSHQPITPHLTPSGRQLAIHLVGSAVIRYRVSHSRGDRIHLVALASLATTLGALAPEDDAVITAALARPAH